MKKRLLALFLMMVLVMTAFAACKSDSKESTTDSNTKQEETKNVTDDVKKKEAVVGDPNLVIDNVNARKAIAMSFDKDFITDEIYADGSVVADYFCPGGISTNTKGEDFRSKYSDGWNPTDKELAKELWAKAKEEVGFDEVEIELLLSDTDNSRKVAEYLKEQLEANLEGLTLGINQQTFESRIDLVDKGDFQMVYSGWGPDYPDPMTFMDMWVTGGGYNNAGYSNPKYDEVIHSGKTGELSDPSRLDDRFEALQDIEAMLVGEDQVLVPLYQRSTTLVYQDYVDGIERHYFGGDYTYDKATSNEINGEKVIRRTITQDIPSMDSSKASDAVSFEVMANTNEGLFKLGKNDVIEQAGVVSYEASEDGFTYTFKLNDKAVWSNGEPVVADDYVYAWRRGSDPATGSQYRYMFETAGILNAVAIGKGEAAPEDLGIKAIDDYTLEVKLENIVPFFIKVMAFPTFLPLNQEFVEAQGNMYAATPENLLYNGPFTLDVWESEYSFELAKNPTYYNKDEVTLDRVTYRIVKDVAASVAMYEDGMTDRLALTAEYIELYLDDPNLLVEEELSIFYLLFNIDFHQ